AAPSTASFSGPIHREMKYQINWNHGNPAFQGTGNTKVNGAWYPSSFGSLSANTWYYLTATYDGETVRVYKDGSLINSNSNPSGNSDPDPNPLTFGKH